MIPSPRTYGKRGIILVPHYDSLILYNSTSEWHIHCLWSGAKKKLPCVPRVLVKITPDTVGTPLEYHIFYGLPGFGFKTQHTQSETIHCPVPLPRFERGSRGLGREARQPDTYWHPAGTQSVRLHFQLTFYVIVLSKKWNRWSRKPNRGEINTGLRTNVFLLNTKATIKYYLNNAIELHDWAVRFGLFISHYQAN